MVEKEREAAKQQSSKVLRTRPGSSDIKAELANEIMRFDRQSELYKNICNLQYYVCKVT
jgi:hypothetical protein